MTSVLKEARVFPPPPDFAANAFVKSQAEYDRLWRRAKSAEAVADRNNDAKARLVVTADGGWRCGKVVPLKQNVDAALAKSPTVEKCVVFNRCDQAIEMKPGGDVAPGRKPDLRLISVIRK
jgi:hypothetical protein